MSKYLIGKIDGQWGIIGEHCYDNSIELGGTVDKDLFDFLEDYPNSYEITQDGQFIQKMTVQEIQNKKLSDKYIPKEQYSMVIFAKIYLKANPPKDSEEKMLISGLYDNWAKGKYGVGDIRNNAGQTWECHQAHDNAVYPDITPDNPSVWATFWRPLHAKSKETARPWVKPQYGTTDMYHAGEYMVYTDEKIYKALRDTVYSPEEYAADWAVVEIL